MQRVLVRTLMEWMGADGDRSSNIEFLQEIHAEGEGKSVGS